MSGLAYEGSGTPTPGTLWAVQNGAGTLLQARPRPAVCGRRPRDVGRSTTPSGVGKPGRRGGHHHRRRRGRRRLRRDRARRRQRRRQPPVDPALCTDRRRRRRSPPTNEWNLTADLPGLGANAGPRGGGLGAGQLPDRARASRRTAGRRTTRPTSPNHGTGLFFVGVEQTGEVIGYALNHGPTQLTRVVTFAAASSRRVTDLVFDPAAAEALGRVRRQLRRPDGAARHRAPRTGGQGNFVVDSDATSGRRGMANLNNEGFAITPALGVRRAASSRSSGPTTATTRPRAPRRHPQLHGGHRPDASAAAADLEQAQDRVRLVRRSR